MMDIIFEILLPFIADTLQIKFSVMCMYDLRQVLETTMEILSYYGNRNVPFFLKFFRLLEIISFTVYIIDFYIDQIQIVRISTDASARFSIGRAIRTV